MGQADGDPVAAAAAAFGVFARREARGRSPAYESLAQAAAADDMIMSFVARLPPGRRQPGLLFAAARYLLGSPPDHGQLRNLIRESRDQLAEVLLTRRTQTNEPARCAVLLPALAQLPEPLALIDVGASAGLTGCSRGSPGLQAGEEPGVPRSGTERPGRAYDPRFAP